jgi:hypothetical protein
VGVDRVFKSWAQQLPMSIKVLLLCEMCVCLVIVM